MEVNQIKQELSQVEQVIQQAAEAIEDDGAASQELRDCVNELDKQSRKARQAKDAKRLIQFVEDMEATSDRAKNACEHTYNLKSQTKSAVLQAHNQLSDLKHQLH